MTRIALLWMLLLYAPVVSPQTLGPSDFTVIEGQPTNLVYDILIDRKGYIWIGHELGISRYNGVSFQTFHHPQQSTLGVSNLVEDKYGRIWYRNFNGQIFYIDGSSVRLFQPTTPTPYLQPFVIHQDELLTGSGDFLMIYNIKNDSLQMLPTTPQNIPLEKIRHMFVSENKVLLLVQVFNKVRLFSYQNGTFSEYRMHESVDHDLSRILYANDSTVIVLAGSQKKQPRVIRLKRRNEVLYPDSIISYSGAYTSRYIWSSYEDEKLWIHNQTFSNTPFGRDSILNMAISNLVTDREGNIWATSMLYGLMMKKNKHNWDIWTDYQHKKAITKIETYQNYVAVSTMSGEMLTTDTSKFRNTKHRSGWPEKGPDQIKWLNLENILFPYQPEDWTQLQDSMGALHAKTAAKDACNMAPGIIVSSTTTNIVALTNGRIKTLPPIIARHFERKKEEGQYQLTARQRVRSVAYDSTNSIMYAGFSDGLFLYTDTSVKELRWRNLPVYAYRIIHHKGKTYVATQNSGVLIIEKDSVISSIDIKDGLSSPTVIKMKIYGNHLWLSCLEDIQVYDLEQKSFIQSYSLPPIKSARVYDLAEINNYVYFATIDGLYEIRLEKEKTTDILPLNYLSCVIVNGTDTLSEGGRLPAQKNNLQFNLDGLYYSDAGRIYFSYRLLGPGGDTNWSVAPVGQNTILLSYLPPGKFKFEARAHTVHGLAAATPIQFSFTIDRPWWQQAWFVLSSIILTAGGTLLYARHRIQRRKYQNQAILEKLEYEKALNESELKALKSQMNPHFIFNCLNTIQEMFMWGDKNAANEQMANFAMLTRLILTVSEKRSIPLSTETEILKRYLELEKLSMQEGFSYEIIMGEDVDEGYIQIPPMIIQPFVENSIKHGLRNKVGDKKLTIIFELIPGDEHLACIIRDNGIGRKKATEIRNAAKYPYASFSTSATEKRLQLVNKNFSNQIPITYTDLKDDTGMATGTLVRIVIPTFV